MSKFWKSRIKNTKRIANKIGVDEEKIQELVDGKREIEGDTFEKVLQAVDEEKINKAIKNVEILQWYKDTDLKQLRLKFGYKSQTALAKALGCDVSVICRYENKMNVDKVTGKLEQLYYFFKDDFNKKVNGENKNNNTSGLSVKEEKKKKKEIFNWYKKTNIRELREEQKLTTKEMADIIGLPITCLNEIERKKKKSITNYIIKVYEYFNKENSNILPVNDSKAILDWYKKTDIRGLRLKEGISQDELSKRIGTSQPCIGDVEMKRTKSVSPTMEKMYNYYNGKNINVVADDVRETDENNNDMIWDWYINTKDLREYGRKFGYSKNKLMAVLNLSYDQIRDFEKHNYKSVTPIVKKIYGFYHNEENRLPEIEWQPDESNTWVKKPIVVDEVSEVIEEEKPIGETKVDCDYKQMYEAIVEEMKVINEKLMDAHNENYKLILQIKRYEKLIDRL